jgi:5-methylcytosine-specific restriction endonuclease McrA
MIISLDKDKRIVNLKLIRSIKDIGHCELCHNIHRLETHHIKSKGASGDDVEDNLICLCWECHRKVHDGNISRHVLYDVVRRRLL